MDHTEELSSSADDLSPLLLPWNVRDDEATDPTVVWSDFSGESSNTSARFAGGSAMTCTTRGAAQNQVQSIIVMCITHIHNMPDMIGAQNNLASKR
jgi:hypothetical protein